jgi:hypothetical protein
LVYLGVGTPFVGRSVLGLATAAATRPGSPARRGFGRLLDVRLDAVPEGVQRPTDVGGMGGDATVRRITAATFLERARLCVSLLALLAPVELGRLCARTVRVPSL